MTTTDPPVPDGSGPRQVLAPQSIAMDQRFDADGLYALRAAIAAHGGDLGATTDEVDRLLIIGSELATNAIRHGGGSGRLVLWRDGSRLCCRVSDGGQGLPDPEAGTVVPDATAVGGRGLWIARRLGDEFDLITGPHGTTVTVTIYLGGPARTLTDPGLS